MDAKYNTTGSLALKPAANARSLCTISALRANALAARDELAQQLFGSFNRPAASPCVQQALTGMRRQLLPIDMPTRRFAAIACSVAICTLFALSFIPL